MTTKTTSSSAWWFCGKCGFKNHPRHSQDNTKCEQCGASQQDASLEHRDYTPGA